MFRLCNSRVCNSHGLQTSADSSATDFDFENESASPLLGAAKLLLPLEDNVKGIFYTTQSLREDHAWWQVCRSREQEYEGETVATIWRQRGRGLCAGMKGEFLFQYLTLAQDCLIEQYLLLGKPCHDIRFSSETTRPCGIACNTSFDNPSQRNCHTFHRRRKSAQVNLSSQRLVHKLYILLCRNIN